MALIDSHCHLNYDFAPKTTDDLVREAGEAGITHLVTIGTDRASIAQVQAISERFANVFHTVGVHPHDAKDFEDEDDRLLREAARHPKCRAIGEIGLDYHYDHSPHDVQIAAFERQYAIALDSNLPIVIHSRDGEADLLAGLQKYCAKLPSGAIPGVIHCFTGTQVFGQACLDLGFFISFSGILTFKNADDLRQCALDFPLDRLLVETDAPYLAPVPFRGKKCEPSMVRQTAEKIAEIKGLPFEVVAETTSRNTRKVFGF